MSLNQNNHSSSQKPSKRENTFREAENRPISLWVIPLFLFSGLIGGIWFGNGARFFDYQQSVRSDYIRKINEKAEAGSQSVQAFDAFMRRGGKIYAAKCSGCHGIDGKGDGVNYPSLANSKWVIGNTAIPAMIVLNGVSGNIQVQGKNWNGNMPSQESGMLVEDLAGLLTYLRNSFGNQTGDLVSKDMAKNAWDLMRKRAKIGVQMTALELKQNYNMMLPGKILSKEVLLDRETLEPIE